MKSFYFNILLISLSVLPAYVDCQVTVNLFGSRSKSVHYAALSADEKHLIVCDRSEYLYVFDAEKFTLLDSVKSLPPSQGMRLWHQTGKPNFIITDTNDLIYIDKSVENNKITLFVKSKNLSTGFANYSTEIYHLENVQGDSPSGYRVPFSIAQAGAHLFVHVNARILELDNSTGKLVRTINTDKNERIEEISVSPNGKYLASVGFDTLTVRLLENETPVLKKYMEVDGLTFLKEDELLAYGEKLQTIDPLTGNELERYFFNYGEVYGVDIKDGYLTASSRYIGLPERSAAVAYDMNTQKEVGVFHLPKLQGYTTFFSHLSNQLWTITTEGICYRFALTYDPLPKVVSQLGPLNKLNSIEFSFDGRQAITTDDAGMILLWDVRSGRILERYSTDESLLEHAVFARDGVDILYQAFGGYRRLHRQIVSNANWGLSNNVFIDIESLEYLKPIVQKQKAQLEKLAGFRKKYNLLENAPAASSFSYFAGLTNDFKSKVLLVNLLTNESKYLEPEDRPLGMSVFQFYDDNTLVYLSTKRQLIFLDVRSGEVVRRIGKAKPELGNFLFGIQKSLFNKAGDTLFTVTDQRIVTGWNLRKAEPFFRISPPLVSGNQESAVDYQQGRLSYLIQVGSTNGVVVNDLRNSTAQIFTYLDSQLVYRQNATVTVISPKLQGIVNAAKLSPDSKRLFVLRYTGVTHLDIWDIASSSMAQSYQIPDLSNVNWEVDWTNNRIAFWDWSAASKARQVELKRLYGNSSIVGGLNTWPAIKFLDVSTGKWSQLSLDEIKVDIMGSLDWLENNYIKINAGFYNLTSQRWLKPTKELISDVSADSLQIFSHSPSNFNSAIVLQSKSVLSDNLITSEGTNGVPITYISKPHPSGVIAVGLSDHSISIRDIRTLQERYRIVQDVDGYYAFLTIGGYYKTSRNSSQSLIFNWNAKTFSLSQFDQWFNRPDIVLDAVGFLSESDKKLMEKAYTKRLRKATQQDLEVVKRNALPSVSIKNYSSIPFKTKEQKLKVIAFANDANVGIERIDFYVNGVPLTGSYNLDTGGSVTVEILLTHGLNHVQVKATNKLGVTSLPEEFTVEYNGSHEPPDLYLITVGINEYKDPKLTLNYAVKDTRDIRKWFLSSNTYNRVFMDSIVNNEVTYERVMGIKDFIGHSRPQDVVVLFFAGHGMLDENLDFRFGTWSADFANPSATGIRYEDIESLMDGIHARNKLILIDACHSGEIDKDEIRSTAESLPKLREEGSRVISSQFNALEHKIFKSGLVDRKGFELMQELFFGLGSATGTQVIVATAGDRYALESKDWNNGIFTYHLLEGIESGKADLNKDKRVTTSELISYLRQSVSSSTNGKQVPRFRNENPQNHFAIWEYD